MKRKKKKKKRTTKPKSPTAHTVMDLHAVT